MADQPLRDFIFDLDGTMIKLTSGFLEPVGVAGLREVLDDAARLGTLHICSFNYNADVILKKLKLDDRFPHDSEMVPKGDDWYKMPKWQRVIERYKLQAGQCIAFDDDGREIKGYREHGIRCYCVKDSDLKTAWTSYKKDTAL
jgi:beta-phosphoglucomutase-like phosphatase (HAD superfamily)